MHDFAYLMISPKPTRFLIYERFLVDGGDDYPYHTLIIEELIKKVVPLEALGTQEVRATCKNLPSFSGST